MTKKPRQFSEQWWWPLYLFFIELLVGASLFVFYTLIAVGLNLFIKFLDVQGINPIILNGLSGLEYLIFAINISLFLSYIIRSIFNAYRQLWREKS